MQSEEHDKKEFAFGKSMVLFREQEHLQFRSRKFDRFAPKHTFLNSVEIKARDHDNYAHSEKLISKLMKQHIKSKIQEKMRKKLKLEANEIKFLEQEGLQSPEQKSLAEIIRKHKFLFTLEKYTKLREKIKEVRTKTQLKREEKKKKISIRKQELGIPEGNAENTNINNPKYIDLLTKSLRKNTIELRNANYENTMKIMNMIKAKVAEEMEKNQENSQEISQLPYNNAKKPSHKRPNTAKK